ncbi:MAG TPA: toll/interleukin-1 receptor domain-containing protein [Sphingomicrobium sp.]|nr:toll/interleukin-1 receptor domain-containing protein [Sphingomicrobium sp.]
MNAPTPEGNYFLSYSRSDEEFALRLAKDLRARGVAMWVDQFDIRPSEHWDRAIERAVRNCRGIVVIVSPRSVESNNVADEISFAIDSGKSVLPVLIERCALPLRLTRMQVIDATGKYERALQLCADELRQRDSDASQSTPAMPAHEPLDPSGVSLARERLAPILGPIAGRLVEKAARQAGSIEELYRILSLRIESEPEREQFLGLGGAEPVLSKAPPPAPEGCRAQISAGELDSMSKLMVRYIGPIAPLVVKREGRAAVSLDHLRDNLAAMITNQNERAEFLRQAGG